MNHPQFYPVVGMFIIGSVSTVIGGLCMFHTLRKGEIVVNSIPGGVIVKEKIRSFFPLRLNYFHALVYTIVFGPGLFCLGLISFYSFIRAILGI